MSSYDEVDGRFDQSPRSFGDPDAWWRVPIPAQDADEDSSSGDETEPIGLDKYAFPEIHSWTHPGVNGLDGHFEGDLHLYGSVESLQFVTKEDLRSCAEAILSVVRRVADSEYFVVTGRSREFVRQLLIATGITSADNVVELDNLTNSAIYKVLSDSNDPAASVNAARNGLMQAGIPLDGSHAPNITVVEDQTATGTKAASYIRVFNSITELGRFRYASFTTPGIISVGSREEVIAKFGERGLLQFIYPETDCLTEGGSAILHILSRLHSQLHPENLHINDNYTEEAQEATRRMIAYMTHCLIKEIEYLASDKNDKP